MGGVEIFGLIGFVLAAYAVVANDSIQTLGTFLSSNASRPWWVLWLFASAILLVVIFYICFRSCAVVGVVFCRSSFLGRYIGFTEWVVLTFLHNLTHRHRHHNPPI